MRKADQTKLMQEAQQLTKDWPKVRIGSVLTRSTETTELRPDVEYREITVRLWGKGVLERSRVIGAEIAGGRRFTARAGQFIASRIDARNGAMGIVPDSLDGAVVTNDFPLFNLNVDRLLPSYIGWLCRTNSFVELCQRASEGTTNRVRLQESRLLALAIPIPPLAEQQRIVARIEELAEQIKEARNIRHRTRDEVNTLWQCKAERIFDALVEETPIYPLCEMVSVFGGGTPSKTNPFYWEGSIPWISPKDMKHLELYDAIDHISEQAVQETPAKMIHPGAVLIVVRGMILLHTFPTAVLRVPAAINQDMKALIPSQKVLPEFLCSMFWAYNPRILSLVEKSTHDTRKLETYKLLETKIAVPSIPKQRMIVIELNELRNEADKLKRLQAETTAELEALMPSILDRAFKGELL